MPITRFTDFVHELAIRNRTDGGGVCSVGFDSGRVSHPIVVVCWWGCWSHGCVAGAPKGGGCEPERGYWFVGLRLGMMLPWS